MAYWESAMHANCVAKMENAGYDPDYADFFCSNIPAGQEGKIYPEGEGPAGEPWYTTADESAGEVLPGYEQASDILAEAAKTAGKVKEAIDNIVDTTADALDPDKPEKESEGMGWKVAGFVALVGVVVAGTLYAVKRR
jgi:hypothetical protein